MQGDTWVPMRLGVRHDNNYLSVTLRRAGRGIACCVHQLVAIAFLGPRPEGMEVAHEDGNPRNADRRNLSWKTPAANQSDRLRHGTVSHGEKHGIHKLTAALVAQMRSEWKSGMMFKDIAKPRGLHPGTVARAIKGESWKHLAND